MNIKGTHDSPKESASLYSTDGVLCIFCANTRHAKIGGIPVLPILHHKMELYGLYQASCISM